MMVKQSAYLAAHLTLPTLDIYMWRSAASKGWTLTKYGGWLARAIP